MADCYNVAIHAASTHALWSFANFITISKPCKDYTFLDVYGLNIFDPPDTDAQRNADMDTCRKYSAVRKSFLVVRSGAPSAKKRPPPVNQITIPPFSWTQTSSHTTLNAITITSKFTVPLYFSVSAIAPYVFLRKKNLQFMEDLIS